MKYGNGGLRKHTGFFGTEFHYLRIPMGKSLDWNDITYSKKNETNVPFYWLVNDNPNNGPILQDIPQTYHTF